MLMNPKKISEVIRMKKKKMLEADLEIIGTSPVPDMNAQDVYDLEKKGQIESTINAPEKINSDDAMMAMGGEADNVGVSEDEKKRMGRLRSYIDSLDV